MRQLILLRHAEAQKQRSGGTDFDRPLTGRGRAEALDAAETLRHAGLRCDTFLVSPALRARETAVIVAAQLDFDRPLLYDPLLYHGAAEALLAPLQRCGSAGAVVMIGHNPSLSALARQLASAPERAAARGADGGNGRDSRSPQPLELSTGGICCIEFAADSWSELQPEQVAGVRLLR